MIYDRTASDVELSRKIILEKVQKFSELTDAEIQTLKKGTMTASTVNRIENKQEELKNLFNDMGYWNTPITNKIWDENDIFNVDDFQRILDNTNVLRQAFFVYKDTPNTPPVSYHWQDINALEKILYDLDVMISNVKADYRYCGEFECGE